MKKKDDVLLSVVCPTYNHEKYIRQAIDSILMQKVNFKYEVIVGEDCSPDNSREILKEYEKNYPDIFTMVYRDKNIGAKNNSQDLLKRANGKYIICLECDDYWIDENKLQKQIDYLETHPTVMAVAHRVVIVDQNGNEIKDADYPECTKKRYTFRDYRNEILPGQTATIMKRNIYKMGLVDLERAFSVDGPGDRKNALICLSFGEVHCFPEVMSAYRYVTTGTSFSAKTAQFSDSEANNYITQTYKNILDFAKECLPNKKAIKAVEQTYFFHFTKNIIFYHGGKKFSEWFSAFCKLKFKIRSTAYVLSRVIAYSAKKIFKIKEKN